MLPPILLVDNQMDRIGQYPAAVLTASSSQPDREPFRVADYRREDTWWEPTSDGGAGGNWIRSNLGVTGKRAADYVFIDRGHNLWGKTVKVELGADGAAWPSTRTLQVPAIGTVGGDPTTDIMCVTEEGALYSFFGKTAEYQYRQLAIPQVASFVPVVPGLLIGARHEHFGYLRTSDPDKGDRTEPSERSQAGRRAYGRVYHWRTMELSVGAIGRQVYDDKIRDLRRLLFEKNEPCVALHNAGDYPAQGWMFQYSGTSYSAATSRLYREIRWNFTEVGARVT